MFLVMYRTTLDDLPVQLCATRQEAEKVRDELETEERCSVRRTIGPDAVEHIRHLFGCGGASACNVTIVEFDEAGKPNNVSLGNSFELSETR
tara:strand:- start:256 stop:531 length:276 start_codon:yes stop_codon:yes gene_type:complete